MEYILFKMEEEVGDLDLSHGRFHFSGDEKGLSVCMHVEIGCFFREVPIVFQLACHLYAKKLFENVFFIFTFSRLFSRKI
jgi:hypothetical protein